MFLFNLSFCFECVRLGRNKDLTSDHDKGNWWENWLSNAPLLWSRVFHWTYLQLKIDYGQCRYVDLFYYIICSTWLSAIRLSSIQDFFFLSTTFAMWVFFLCSVNIKMQRKLTVECTCSSIRSAVNEVVKWHDMTCICVIIGWIFVQFLHTIFSSNTLI